jgi:hypothetical protein
MGISILHTREGVLDGADAGVLTALQARLAEGPKQILVHLHGGLVDEAQGAEIAERLSGAGPNAFNAPADWEQVYVVWRTGLGETLAGRLRVLAEHDPLYRALLRALLRIVSGKLRRPAAGGRDFGPAFSLTPTEVSDRLESSAAAPFGDIDTGLATGEAEAPPDRGLLDATSIVQALQADPAFLIATRDLAAGVVPSSGARGAGAAQASAAAQACLQRLDADVKLRLAGAAEGQGGRSLLGAAAVVRLLAEQGAAIGLRVLGRIRRGRDHGLHASVVEELLRQFWVGHVGAGLWAGIKAEAASHFSDGRCGRQLIAALTSRPDHRLLLVGHSAGAIWLSDMLRAAADKAPLRADVVFLAPAVRVTDFVSAMAVAGGAIARFRLFAMCDDAERRDALFGEGAAAIYPSSLLYLVSGLCETEAGAPLVDAPILGLQRFLAGAVPDWLTEREERAALAEARTFLSAPNRASCFSPVNNGAGLWSDAISHRAFDTDPHTLESVAAMFA